ncbi:hypothetical protein P262_04669 [Cronobacter malonaticus]|uniref:Uncharacterized protein n=1 Tax=Cronobacter malonaticus TaxID=413503 RepID=V5U3Y2_9ENTR|nr:hypothetical protein P262_04669 [Cronobacter malonaticus]
MLHEALNVKIRINASRWRAIQCKTPPAKTAMRLSCTAFTVSSERD